MQFKNNAWDTILLKNWNPNFLKHNVVFMTDDDVPRQVLRADILW